MDARSREADAHAGAGPVTIAAIDGMGGIGKTTLAVHAAYRLRSSFPDGQLFLDLHGHTPGLEPLRAGEALDWLLRSLGVAAAQIPADPDERAALYRSRLSGTRTLVLLDNAASAGQVRPLLPGAGECLVLITSRRRLTGLDEAAWLGLDALSALHAVELLSGVAGPGRVDAEDPDAARLVALCGHLPLAVRTVGARLRSHQSLGAGDLLARLRDEGTRLGRLRDGDRDPAAVFASSYAALPAEEQGLFRALALVPGPDFDVSAAAAVAGRDRPDVEHLLESLLDHSLLIQHEPGRYRFHDLVRLYARTLADTDTDTDTDVPEDREAARARLGDHYLRWASAADRYFVRHTRVGAVADDGSGPADPRMPTDRASAQRWMRAERANLLAAVYADPRRGGALAGALSAFLLEEGPWDQTSALHRTTAGAAHDRGDRWGEANARWELGRLLNLLGDSEAATGELDRALRGYQAVGDRLGEANALWEKGRARGARWDNQAAVALHEQALAIYQELGDRMGEANILWGLGTLAWLRFDIAASADFYARAEAGYRALGHRLNEFDALIGLGLAHWVRGAMGTASEVFHDALALARANNHHLGESEVLLNVGRARLDTGDLAGAAEALDATLALHHDLGLHHRTGRILMEMGRVRLANRDPHGAAELLEQALTRARDHDELLEEAYTLVPLGAARLDVGDVAGAFAALERSRAIARDLNMAAIDARASVELARAFLRAGDPAAATEALAVAREVFEHLGTPWGLSLVHSGLGAVAAAAGDVAVALEEYREAARLARVSGDWLSEARALDEVRALEAGDDGVRGSGDVG